MVRVSHRKWIELLSGALRATELEAEILARRQEAARAEAAILVRERNDTSVALDDWAELVADPPLTTAGNLHVEAFGALVDARVWLAWQQEHEALVNVTREA